MKNNNKLTKGILFTGRPERPIHRLSYTPWLQFPGHIAAYGGCGRVVFGTNYGDVAVQNVVGGCASTETLAKRSFGHVVEIELSCPGSCTPNKAVEHDMTCCIGWW